MTMLTHLTHPTEPIGIVTKKPLAGSDTLPKGGGMAKADYYDQLGVDRSANAAELKSAYRKLAKKYHPDVNPGDAAAEQKFKDVSEAYEVLKDEQSRAAYDQFGHAAFEQGGPGGMGGIWRARRHGRRILRLWRYRRYF